MLKPLLVAIAILLLLPNFFNIDINPPSFYDHKEEFDPSLSYINTIDKLDSHVDSIVSLSKVGTLEYSITLAKVIRKRFYHGFSHFSLQENWMAAMSGKFVEYGLACKVQPEEIVEHDNAACSQQALVMMAVLRKKNIPYRSVGFPHHYALEALINDKWYYFDTNMEPKIGKNERLEDNWQSSADYLKRYYDTTRFKDLDYKFGNHLKVTHGPVNEVPAPNARLFHSVTGILSKTLWCVPLLIVLYRRRSPFRSKSTTPSLSV